ncbi:MAG: hypothetical protein C4297_07195 [Gemmataceae bacterium]
MIGTVRHNNDTRARQPARRGVVLLAVLVVVALLTLAAYQFHNAMSAELETAQAFNRVQASRIYAQAGLHYAAFVLSHPQAAGLADADDSTLLWPPAAYDAPDVFQHRPVGTTSSGVAGYFTIVAPRDPDDPLASSVPWRFGVTDESGKLNINTLVALAGNTRRARQMLLRLPNMTEETVDALLNWMGRGDSTSAAGDSLYYSSLGYTLKNGPFESLEEMLLVRGITPRMLYGNDLNRNGLPDPGETSTGLLTPGLMHWLTIYSRELNVDSQGLQRLNLNDTDLQSLYDELVPLVGENLARFILAYRIYGGSTQQSGSPSQRPGSSGQQSTSDTIVQDISEVPLDFNARPRGRIGSLLDLVDAVVTYREEREFVPLETRNAHIGLVFLRTVRYQVTSPLRSDDFRGLEEKLSILYDRTATDANTELVPRINVNTAPREVLALLSGLSEQQVQSILDNRPGADTDPSLAPLYRTPVWLVTRAGIGLPTLRELERYITARSQVFRVQVLGYAPGGAPAARLEAVINTNNGRPQILFWRDLTDLGATLPPALLPQ